MVWLLVQHLLVVMAMILVVASLCRWIRFSPAVQHLLWLVVLVKLLTPPLVMWPWSASDLLPSHLETSRGPVAGVTGTEADARKTSRLADSRPASAVGAPADVTYWDMIPPPSTVAHPTARVSMAAGHISFMRIFCIVLLGTWLGGALLALGSAIQKISRVHRMVVNSAPAPAWLAAEVRSFATVMRIRPPRVLVSEHTNTPFTWCLSTPVLVWPACLADPATAEPRRGILIHELAHLRRRDHWVIWLDLLARVVWWWNPCARYASDSLREAAELACDAWVIRILPDDRRTYADSLVNICHYISQSVLPTPALSARAGSRRAFERRLTMIMGGRDDLMRGRWAWPLATLLLATAVPSIAWEHALPPADAQDSTQVKSKKADPKDDQAVGSPTKKREGRRDSTDAPANGFDLPASLLGDVAKQLAENYVDEIDQQELIDAAVKAMLEKLDHQTSLLSPDDLKDISQSISQTVGVGIVLEVKGNHATVMNLLPSSPGLKAGLQVGDVIEQVDGKTFAELEGEKRLAAFVRVIRGKPGEAVTLGIRRENSDDIEQIQIVRGEVKVDSVVGRTQVAPGQWDFMLDSNKKIGYIRIVRFSSDTAGDVRAALEQLKSLEIRALVLDLRNCPGGLLTEAVQTADLFVKSGVIVNLVRRGASDAKQEAHAEGTESDLPLAVLVNRFSASAAEIVAASLQDHKRAIVVGEKTNGRGIVQAIIQLKNGGALKLTTGKILRPNGQGIRRYPDSKDDQWGVSPDKGYAVAASEKDLKTLSADQRLRGLLGADPKTLPKFNDRNSRKPSASSNNSRHNLSSGRSKASRSGVTSFTPVTSLRSRPQSRH